MQIVKAFTDIKIVGGVLLSVIFALSAYANSTYVRIDGIPCILVSHEIKEIRRSIAMFEIDKNTALNDKEKRRYTLKIKLAENQIKELKGE